MTGDEVNLASLFRLYVDYGRYPEATNFLLEYIESCASMVNFSPFFVGHGIDLCTSTRNFLFRLFFSFCPFFLFFPLFVGHSMIIANCHAKFMISCPSLHLKIFIVFLYLFYLLVEILVKPPSLQDLVEF